MNDPLEQVLRHPRIWRGGGGSGAAPATVPTGFRRLNERLPGGGRARHPIDGEPFAPQARADGLTDHGVVFDQQQPCA